MIPILFSGGVSFFFVILSTYLGAKLFKSSKILLIAVQTTVLSVTVEPTSVPKGGSELPVVPAVVHSKTRPVGAIEEADLTTVPRVTTVLAVQAE